MAWQIVTNAAYRSIEHRATVNSIKERLSVATFYSPKLNGDMGPAPSLVSPDSPSLFKRIGVADYFKGLFSRELHGKSYLEVLRTETGEAQNNWEVPSNAEKTPVCYICKQNKWPLSKLRWSSIVLTSIINSISDIISSSMICYIVGELIKRNPCFFGLLNLIY